jgi:sRNA-binding protein
MKKYSLFIVILIGFFILGLFYYISELNKQKSIERQQQIEIQENRRIEEQKEKKEAQIRQEGQLIAEKKDYDKKVEKYRIECSQIKEDNSKRFIDFINTCTSRGGNTIDFCVNSEAGVLLAKNNSNDFINKCIENKINSEY